jgi:hypothetical protein
MTDLARYFVAKHVSDLQRMEPKNIGVIVWTQSQAAGRFLAERPGAPGDVDGRSIPPFVASASAYKQWVAFWRGELGSKPTSPGKALNKWAEKLKQTSRGSFWLAEGGVILADAQTQDIGELADDLFAQLVESSTADDVRDPALDQVADGVIKRLRLARNECFHSRYQVSCPVAPNVSENFEFSHAYKNGTLKRLYQRVPLASRRTPLRRTVHDSAWMFEKVVQQRIVAREQAIALVYATAEQKKDPTISWSFDVLGSVARLANLADPDEALAAFAVD